MKRSEAQDAQHREYKARANAKLDASFAEPVPPSESWWASANGDFYARAKEELPRMMSSTIGQQFKLITATGYAYERRKPESDGDTTAEL